MQRGHRIEGDQRQRPLHQVQEPEVQHDEVLEVQREHNVPRGQRQAALHQVQPHQPHRVEEVRLPAVQQDDPERGAGRPQAVLQVRRTGGDDAQGEDRAFGRDGSEHLQRRDQQGLGDQTQVRVARGVVEEEAQTHVGDQV